MNLFLFLIIGLSLGLMISFFWLSLQKYTTEKPTFRILTLLFAIWLVAAAFWGPEFFIVRIPGLFDITIERILFAIILLVMISGLIRGEVNLRRNITIEFFMFLFSITCIISMMRFGFISPLPELFPNPWFVFITGYLFPFVAFVFAKNYLTDERDQLIIFHILFFLGSYLAIIAFFEFFNLRQFVFPRYINDPKFWLHLERARGPFLNGALNGVAMTIGFVCGVHLLPRKQGFTKLFYLVLLSLFFPAIFFTQTRSSYLGFLIALILLLVFYRTTFPKWSVFSLPLAMVMIFIIFVSPRLLSTERRAGGIFQLEEVEIRLQLIKRSIEIFTDRPLTGVGLGQFLPISAKEYRGRGTVAEKAEEQTQHFHLLGMLVEIGLLGLVTYLLIITQIFRRLYQMIRVIPETGFLGPNFLLIIFAVWCVYLNNNLFVEPSYFVYINSVPFMLGGMADGLYTQYMVGSDKAGI